MLNTVPRDIEKIIEFERKNNEFVGEYSKDRHTMLLTKKDCFHLSIRRLDNNNIVGHMIILGLCNENKNLECKRLVVHEKGCGFGRESIKLLKRWCFEKLKFHRLWLDVYDDNDRAIGLYESEGFFKEGTLRDIVKTDKGYRSKRMYSILEHEYNPKK